MISTKISCVFFIFSVHHFLFDWCSKDRLASALNKIHLLTAKSSYVRVIAILSG